MPQDAPPPEASQPMLEIVRDLPLEVHVAAMIGLGAGLALWLVGRRLLKVVFVLLGIAQGGALGFVIAPLTGYETFEGIDVTHIGLGAGAVAGIIAASFLFRFTIAVSTSAVMAVAGLLGASVYLAAVEAAAPPSELPTSELALEGVPFEDETPPAELPLNEEPSRPFGFIPEEQPAESGVGEEGPLESGQQGEHVGEIVDTARERVREFMIRLGNEARELWASQPTYDRSVMTLAALASAALGAMIGLVVPTWASAVVTSLAGAAIWIPCGLWLANTFDLPGVEHVQGISPKNWLIVWGVVALVGATAQWSGFSTRKFGKGRRRTDDDYDDDEDDDV